MTRGLRNLAAAATVALQLAVLYWPRPPSVPSGGLPLDKVAHVVVFALPVVALVAVGASRRWVAAAMVVHAAASELVQHTLLARRSGDPGDVAADLVGVALGVLVARRWAGDASADPPAPARPIGRRR